MGGVFPIITAFYLPLDLQRNLGGPKGYCCLFKDLDWLENWNWEDITLWRSHKFKFGATRTVIGPLKFYLWGSNTCLAPQVLFVRIKHMFGPSNLGLGGTKTVFGSPNFTFFCPPTRKLDLFCNKTGDFCAIVVGSICLDLRGDQS